MDSEGDTKLTLPRLLLCEGPDDIAFFRTLIDNRNLPNFHIRSTGKNRHDKGGNSKFGEKLRAMRLVRGFSQLQHIIIVTDADDDSAVSFENVRQQLINLGGLVIPNEPNVQAGGSPSLTVVVLPFSGCGSLETYCIEAARSVDSNLANNVDTFRDLATNQDWPEPKRDKLWLRAMLAGFCKRDPMVNFGPAVTDHRYGRPIPTDHKSFNGIAKILESFR